MVEKILIVEDELALQETLEYNLSQQGYLVKISADGPSAIDLVQAFQPNLILLDLMLPGLDGFEVCRLLRNITNAPILILTAKDEEVDRVIGLEVGADDYITKPFSMRELLARIKAHLRRVRLIKESLQSIPSTVLSSGNLRINLESREVKLGDKILQLKPKEYDLLTFLLRNKGKVLSRNLILERVWGWEFAGGTRTVDVHIRWLREKIENDASNPERLITVRGIGYIFEG